MKIIIATLGILIFHCYICSAQTNSSSHNNKVEKVKVEFITNQLHLSVNESRAFWPVYHKYFSQIRKAWQESNGDRAEFEEKAATIKDEYRGTFADILHSHERANEVFNAEKAYRAMLRKELKQRENK
ncbi:MAG TPA: hypothetical protein VFQ86_02175 [Arachidicoccus soli]|uniref:Uncharacterized protein n=1 Tax=Arachidicoccus soli TaxID=2341117 RepID=A0A386HMN0_9BACT|nr:hypothetical protein [Arachidicoccus soli]AYD46889.1 hypothetical protein D6B99_04225 [Arachidicoccus soli]HEU0226518.1 hypothetical protein [Arachidicoccus soli]